LRGWGGGGCLGRFWACAGAEAIGELDGMALSGLFFWMMEG